MPPQKFADGSGVVPNSRAESAFVRCIDSCMVVGRSADRLSAEIDRVGAGSGTIRLPLDDDDSLVNAVRDARNVIHPTK